MNSFPKNLFRRWKLILCLLLVFGSGVIVGGGITLRSVKKYAERRMDSTQWEPRTMDWLKRELELSDSQIEPVHPAVKQAVEELVKLSENAEAEYREILGKMLLEISEQLNEQQLEKLRALINKGAELK